MVFGPDGKKLLILGYLNLNLIKNSKLVKSKIYIFKNLKHNLLEKLEIVKFDLSC